MYFEQFYLTCLAHASYMLASEGVAAVVDPQRDVDLYIEEAKKNGLRIAYVIETHLHADFVSGHRELAARSGAQIVVSRHAGATFPHLAVKDGDTLEFGRCVLRFLETPGHTPESTCILITDAERGPEPWAVLTGDTLFIGDVGRPDLSPTHTPQQLAGMLYDSLHGKLLKLPNEVEVYPAHGAGSLCGRNISSERHSTIGHERLYNYALQPMSRDDFVQLMTADLPERPEYFSRDAEINRTGALALEELPPLPALSPAEVQKKQAEGILVLDTRPAALFGAGHVPGAINVGLGGQYASWAARLIGLDQPLILVAEDPDRVWESRMRLARVGMEKVVGQLEGGVLAWQKAGLPLDEVPQVSVHDVHEQLKQGAGLQVLDVRRDVEWNSGHIAEAQLASLDRLRPAATPAAQRPEALAGLDPARPVAVHCKSGYRSSIATSLLQRLGFRQVMNVTGGFDAWSAQKLPSVAEKGATSCSAAPAISTGDKASSTSTTPHRTGMAMGLCVFVLLTPSLWNLAATKWKHARNPVPGNVYSVDGREMHIYCTGTGSTTVVLEAAASATWLAWRRVQPQLSQLTRVCTYDRAGHGWSEPRPGPRDAEAIVRELHTLLDLAGVPRPLLLAGHSAGGLYVREYHRQFPAEVAGVVLIDSSSPRQLDELPGWREAYERNKRNFAVQLRWERLRIWSGWERLVGNCGIESSSESEYNVGQYDALMCRPVYVGGEESEYIYFEEASRQAARLTSFGSIPLLIISRDPDLRNEASTPEEIAAEQSWGRLQEEMKSLSPLSWRVIARGAGHAVHHDRIDLVMAEMKMLIGHLGGGPAPSYGGTVIK